MTGPRRLMVKFSSGKDPEEKSKRIRGRIGDELVKEARQLFPGDPDDELTSIFEVVLEESASVEAAKMALGEERDVEYCHEPAERWPS